MIRHAIRLAMSVVLCVAPAGAAEVPFPFHSATASRPSPVLPIAAASFAADVCAIIAGRAADNGLPPDFIARLIAVESRFNPNAVSPAGAQGIAQFMPGTARLRRLADPFDPAPALAAAIDYLGELKARFGNLGLAAAAYNAGEGGAARFLAGRGLPLETEDYVRIRLAVGAAPAVGGADRRELLPRRGGAQLRRRAAPPPRPVRRRPADGGAGAQLLARLPGPPFGPHRRRQPRRGRAPVRLPARPRRGLPGRAHPVNRPKEGRHEMSTGAAFRALHEEAGAFVIPNPWDAGTARILTAMGFRALATTSAGMAFSLGVAEGSVSREETLRHCAALVAATPLPVSADLEQGFGDSPESAAETVRAAAAIGLAGCSLEDHTGRRDDPIYDFTLAVERIEAAADACRSLAQDFVLTARCENFLWGRPDLDDTVRRLQAFERAGAHVLYAPGLRDLDTIRTVCAAVTRPVNVMMGLPGATFGVAELAAAGVKRVSVGSALARLAFGAFVNAAREMRSDGTFRFSESAIGFAELEGFFTGKTTA